MEEPFDLKEELITEIGIQARGPVGPSAPTAGKSKRKAADPQSTLQGLQGESTVSIGASSSSRTSYIVLLRCASGQRDTHVQS